MQLGIQNFVPGDLVHHPPPEVRHVVLLEGELRPPAQVLSVLTHEHPAVPTIVLLWDFLCGNLAPLA